MLKLKIFIAGLFLLLSLSFPNSANAAETDKFITVVNPVRISSYNKFPEKSVGNQYEIIRKNGLPATWLLTFDALNNRKVIGVIKNLDNRQEFGAFLEISPSFADSAGVKYHDTGSWHYATSVFLSGYTRDERQKLIDSLFQKFKDVFGYYPKSVGAWGTDSFSLTYMKDKYGITANLTCSDQFSTDGYQIWGQPWALPYYPSRFYSMVPASTDENKLDIVNIQWAPRGPVNGYYNSLYSTQDYLVAPKPQNIDYFKRLVDLYSSYGQVTVGLESDLDPDMYKYEYARQIEYVGQLSKKGIRTVTMSTYADWYRQTYPKFSPASLITSVDYLGSGTKAFWYTSTRYRIYYTENDGKTQIVDLRVYDPSLQGPYSISPNLSLSLSRNIPYIVSASDNPEEVWVLPEGASIIPHEEYIQILGENIGLPEFVKKSKLIKLKKQSDGVTITFVDKNFTPEGTVYKDFSSEAAHFFKQKKAFFMLLIGQGWNFFKKVEYLIPQGEMYALLYLQSLPSGKILVYDHECLQCTYHTRLPDPAFSNMRGYVGKYSGDKMVYNKSIFEASDRKIAKKDLERSGVRYIYLVKFENYEEKLPFSPGDLGITKIFSNANAEIWKVLPQKPNGTLFN